MRVLVLVLAVLALAGCSKPQQEPANRQAAAEAGPQKGVDRSHKGQAAPDVAFDDRTELSATVGDGTPVLVNLWATWCAPCVKELPTIDRLALEHSVEGDLGVLAVSQDSGPPASVAAFLKRLDITHVGTVQDSKMALSGALGPDAVLPTSILYDAQGREVWRYVGDLDWTGPEAARLLSEAGAPAAAKG